MCCFFRRKLASLLRPASSSALSDEKIASNVVSASATQVRIALCQLSAFRTDAKVMRCTQACSRA